MAAGQPEAAPVTDRGRRTRAALVQAGQELFEERGFADVRIDHVAERAGVSHGTFYTWFDSKESLLRAIVAVVVEDIFAASAVGSRLPADAAYARIEAANRLYLTAVTRHARILRVLDSLADTREEFRRLRVDVRESFVQRGMEGLVRLQEEGLADPALPPRPTASALGAMVESFAHLWQDPVEDLDEDAAVAVLTRLWAGAIGLPRSAWPESTPQRPA
ncbi:TetR/AcrR family transcriptional regulator [Geodermatophilus sp. DF01_2]|uniref:TetR/AcrR family transcriptional regulator n=1 Tax=Geodermatophilus sp. DF01-2 TaxID=2559610 RepID=UPI00142F49B4|nr:TetR/AcrR family transcriptional regulator [Geodermatophilus sp. DF01_2]